MYDEYGEFSLFMIFSMGLGSGKTAKNGKLRDTLVTVPLDGMHMCIQVI